MANKFIKGVSGATGGAGVGSMFGPIGAGIGAGVGFLGGLFSGDDPDIPSKNFSDINLQQDNPELYKQIVQNQAILDQLQQSVNARRSGPTDAERFDLTQQSNQLANRLASNGMSGTPMGEQMMHSQYNQGINALRDHAMNQYMAMQGQLANQGMNLGNLVRGGLQDVQGQNNTNTQRAINQNQASSQFWTGLAGAGLGAYGQMNNAANWANVNGVKYDPMAIFNQGNFQPGQNYNPVQAAAPVPTFEFGQPMPFNDYAGNSSRYGRRSP